MTMKFPLLALWLLGMTAYVSTRCIEDDIRELKETTKKLLHQTMMCHAEQQDRVRSQGTSGIVQQRKKTQGTRPYHMAPDSVLNMHEHANHVRTLAMGDFQFVLNGISARTRHNDFMMVKPAAVGSAYGTTQNIDYPPVPPEVLAKTTLEEQAEELRKWFLAWKNEDRSVRDYRKYIKPVMCYLEGAWTHVNESKIDESFFSDRHKLDAFSWYELREKEAFITGTGRKDEGENTAFLPSAIIGMVNTTTPIFAQFNYRILCHPLKRYVERSWLRLVDQLDVRLKLNLTKAQYANRRGARFRVNPNDSANPTEGTTSYELIDELMAEIPGKDGYEAFLKDDAFGYEAKHYLNKSQTLNAAYYHRKFQVANGGANNSPLRFRGYHDNVYMAMTTQPKVAPFNVDDGCKITTKGLRQCKYNYKQRWSYAFPIEFGYITSLGSWNPYKLDYDETGEQCDTCKGVCGKGAAYEKATGYHFFLTPPELFKSGNVVDKSAADTSKRAACVKDKNGVERKVLASGLRIMLPEMDGVGVLRMRYPIFPVHQENSWMGRNFAALNDLLFDDGSRFKKIKEELVGLNMWP